MKTDLTTVLSFLAITGAVVSAQGQGPAETKDTSPANYFINPGPTGDDNFVPGEVIHVSFVTDFKDPVLSLYCGGLVNPRFSESVKAPGYDVNGTYTSAIPNCYFPLQEGPGRANTQPSIGTGIFAIGDGTEDGRVLQEDQKGCPKCPVCPEAATASRRRSRLM